MSRYVIIVEFQIYGDAFERFLELLKANAASSLKDEPGCERFDVLIPKDGVDQVVLYEIYKDRAAFDAHCQAPHFFVFDAAVRPLIKEKCVRELGLIEAHRGPLVG